MNKGFLDYKHKLDYKYSGLVFDLDGTLLNEEGFISEEISTSLQHFTKMGVYVILATGRSPRDTNNIIKRNNLFTREKAYTVNFNGGLVREIHNDETLTENIIKEVFLERASDIYNLIIGDTFLHEILLFKEDGEYKYSDWDEYGITLHFKNEVLIKYDIFSDIFYKILDLLNNNGFCNFKITVSGKTIDIFSDMAGKENGIVAIGNKLGISSKSLLRIGDLGGEFGNDNCMLRDRNGITVNEGDSAIKVYCENGELLCGQNAIKKIIEDVKLNSSYVISRESFYNNGFLENKKKKYSFYSQNIRSRFIEISTSLINEILINRGTKLNMPFDISKIFSFNGSVMFSIDEINDKNRQYFEKYFIKYGNTYYGRGKIFYFFEINTNNNIGREIESIEIFNYMIDAFFYHFRDIINDFNNFRENVFKKVTYTKTDYKLYLTLIDYLKNFLIKFIHFLSFGLVIGLKIDPNDLSISKEFLKLFVKHYYDFFELRDNLSFIDTIQLESIINKYSNLAQIDNGNFSYNFAFYNRILRGVPEVSHPYVNYVYGNISSSNFSLKGVKNPIIIGTHFGGIEIPYILNSFFEREEIIVKGIIGIHNSRYEYEGIPMNFSSDYKYDIDNIADLIKNNDVIITDDGVFSGETILTTGLEISRYGAKNIHFTTQTFPGGRAGELFKTHGCLDENIIQELFENGLVRNTPIFTGPSKKKNRLFNIEEQRILDITSKGQ